MRHPEKDNKPKAINPIALVSSHNKYLSNKNTMNIEKIIMYEEANFM